MDASKRLWRILSSVNFGLDVFILFFLIAYQWVEIPGFLQVFGRTHPMVLHFPVVFIFLLPVIPWVLSSLSLGRDETHQFMGNYIILAHFLCAMTVLFGLILSVEGGYSGDEVAYHKWGGVILLLILVILENGWNYREIKPGAMRYVLFVPMVVLVIASHIGAGITHGSDFLTEPLFQDKTQKVPLEQAIVFRDVIHPIMEQKCMNCHNSSKSKGELILEDSASILKGGEDGFVIDVDDRLESPLLQRLLLDIDHEDHMPPKGKQQLSHTEIGLIREWITRKDLFDLRYNELDPADAFAVLIEENYYYEPEPVYDMDPADDDDIASLNDDYRLLIPLADESPALYARFLSASHFKDEQLTALTKVGEQVVDLNVRHMPVDDEDIAVVGNFGNLQVLNLNGTEITDKGLTVFHELKNLQKLYLAQTDVSADGIRGLLEANPVKKLYLWSTGVDTNDMDALRKQFSNTIIIGESNVFGNEIIALNPPLVKPDDPFFRSSTTVKVNHPIPNVTIRYTTDGSDPDSLSSTLYDTPLQISKDSKFRFRAFKEGWLSSPVIDRSFYVSRYSPDSTWFITKPNQRYAGLGPKTLTDFKVGEKTHEDKNYLGYRESDGVFGFRFKEPVLLDTLVVSGLTKTNSFIFPPSRIVIEITDEEGNWVKMGETRITVPDHQIDYEKYYVTVPLTSPVLSNRVKVTVVPVPHLPAWHRNKGDNGWVFVDEVLFQ